MNQHQRKFLLDEIDNQYKREQQALRATKPRAPSLNTSRQVTARKDETNGQ